MRMLRLVLALCAMLGTGWAPNLRNTSGHDLGERWQIVRFLHKDGWTINRVAVEFGRSWRFVKETWDKWVENGIPVSRFEMGEGRTGCFGLRTEECNEFIMWVLTTYRRDASTKLLVEGLSGIIGVVITRGTVCRWLHDLGWVPLRGIWSVRAELAG